jgi:hypothetical protein
VESLTVPTSVLDVSCPNKRPAKTKIVVKVSQIVRVRITLPVFCRIDVPPQARGDPKGLHLKINRLR